MRKKTRRPRKLKPTKPSRRAELQYKAELIEVVGLVRKVVRAVLLPVLQRTAPEYQRATVSDSRMTDGYAGEIMAAFEEMAKQFGGIDRIAARLAEVAVKRQAEETDKQLIRSIADSLGISIELAASIRSLNVGKQIEAATIANVELIKSIPAESLDKIKRAVLTDVARGRRYEDLASDIEAQFEVSEARAKLIARDQMAKVNASITEAKQVALGITRYEWSTSNDERVRPEHQANSGEIFRWDKPPATGHPGEDYQCRCVAIPVLDDE